MSLALLALTIGSLTADVPAFAVRMDRSSHQITIRLGPFHLPASGGEHAGMHHHGLELPVFRFVLPAGAWLRGFRVALYDGEGRALPRRILHHINLMDLGRRQLTEPIFERTLAAGQETGDVMLPASVAVRVEAGAELALLTAWANQTGEDLHGVTLELTLPYLPDNIVPRPLEVRPVVFDVGFRPGFSDAFDLDTGRTVHQREFVVPLDGRLLAAGGHLHDYGESLVLTDAATGKVVVALKPTRDAQGHVLAIGRKFFGAKGAGLRLKAGRYVLVAVYRNPTGHCIEDGGMALIAALFAPDQPGKWPALDRTNPVFVADAGGLDRIGWVTVAEDLAARPRRP